MSRRQGTADPKTVERLLRGYLANGVTLELNPTATQLALGFHGMGKVVIEATDDGLVIHEPVAIPAPAVKDDTPRRPGTEGWK